MPELSRFFGMIITMNFGDHPPPHIHVRYNEFKALFVIENGALLAGQLPPKAYGLIIEWMALHRSELREAWKLSEKNLMPSKIKPLE